jgi:hypothetical protein
VLPLNLVPLGDRRTVCEIHESREGREPRLRDLPSIEEQPSAKSVAKRGASIGPLAASSHGLPWDTGASSLFTCALPQRPRPYFSDSINDFVSSRLTIPAPPPTRWSGQDRQDAVGPFREPAWHRSSPGQKAFALSLLDIPSIVPHDHSPPAVIGRLTPRCSGQYRRIRACIAAELIRR